MNRTRTEKMGIRYALAQVMACTDTKMTQDAMLGICMFKGYDVACAYKDGYERLRSIHIAIVEELRHKWSLGDSTEAKYKEEAYQELLDILEEE